MIQASLSQKNIPLLDLQSHKNQDFISKNYQISPQSIYIRAGKSVHQGWKIQRKTPVTIKIIQHRASPNRLSIMSKQYIKHLNSLDCKHLLKYIDSEVTPSKLYLFAQNVDSTLDNYIRKHPNLTQADILQLFYQLCSALHIIKLNNLIVYDFDMNDIYISNDSIRLDCLTYPQRQTRDSSMADITMGDTIFLRLGLVLKKLCFGYTRKEKKSELPQSLNNLIEWCSEPDQYKIYSLDQLLIKIQKQVSIGKNVKGVNKNKCLLRIDKVLLNQLNYIVFLQKLVEMIQKDQEIRQDHQILVYIIKFNTKVKITKLSKIHETNVFLMQEWDKFIKHKNFQTYLNVVDQLFSSISCPIPPQTQDKRLQFMITDDYSQTEGFLLNYQYYLRKFISRQKLNLKLNGGALSEADKNVILLFDYLLSAYQINGLNIEYYRDSYMFAMQSYLDSIVKGTMEFDSKIVGFLSKKMQTLQF